MILVDMNQVMIANMMMQIGNHQNAEIDENMLRHMILNSLRSNRNKFHDEFGELIICCDDGNYWRRQIYPYYKVALVSNTEDELSALRAENDKLRRRGESQSRSTPTRYLVDMERITREKEHLELAVRMRDMCRIFCPYTAPHHTVLYPQLNYF